MMVEIRKGEPLSEPSKRGRRSAFPEIYQLQEGECAVYAVEIAKRVRNTVANASRLTGHKYNTRTVEEDDGYGHPVMVFKVFRRKEQK